MRVFLKIFASCFGAVFFIALLSSRGVPMDDSNPWKEADEGLQVAEFESSGKSDNPFSITVVRIDPAVYSLKLLCASEHGKQKLTAREWCEKHHLLAAVNAGMFQQDGFTSVGYMKNFGYVNNSRVTKFNNVLAFNPVEENLPAVRIIDRECDDFNVLRRQYQTMVQSIRMISCDRQNVWSRQNAKWSTLAVGMDAEGKVLFLFSRTPLPVHDLIEILLALPLSLKSAMYLEGGPQASLYLSTPKMTLERNGAWEGLEDGKSFQFALPIPNVIGITKKTKIKS